MEIDDRVCFQQCHIQPGAWLFAGIEMLVLVLGLTGSTMILGWTQGIGLSDQDEYTPIWACIVFMVLLTILVLTLILAMLGMGFHRTGLIVPHLFFLLLSWVITLIVCIITCVLGGPILTAIFILLYFTLLLGFGWTLYHFWKWTAAMDHR